MAQQNISQGNPPIVWSTIDEAFQKINANFTELYLSIGGSGADLSGISSSLVPDIDVTRDLGSPTRRWKDLYLSGSSLYLGLGVITSDPLTGAVNLPEGSTIGDVPLKEPSFQALRVTGQEDIVADSSSDIMVFTGNGINITTDPNSDTVTFTNAGVTELSAGIGLSVNAETGNILISNTGVIELIGSAGGIGVSSTTGLVTLTNLGVTQLTTDPGSGIAISASTGVIQITNTAPNIPQDVYKNIAVFGQPTLIPGNPNSTLQIIPGDGISILTNEIFNTLTVSNNGVTGLLTDGSILISGGSGSVSLSLPSIIVRNFQGDLVGSVFADNSTMLIDGTNGTIVAPVFANVTGNVTGDVTGDVTGNVTGDVTGSVFADNSTMLIDGTGGKIVGPLEGNSFSGTLNFDGSIWSNVPGSSSVTVISNINDFINSGSVNFSYAVGDRSTGFNISFSTPLTETSKVRIAELQSTRIVGDLLGSVFSDTSSLIVNGVDGSLMYYPANSGDWGGIAPTTVGEALDRLAAVVKLLNGGTGA